MKRPRTVTSLLEYFHAFAREHHEVEMTSLRVEDRIHLGATPHPDINLQSEGAREGTIRLSELGRDTCRGCLYQLLESRKEKYADTWEHRTYINSVIETGYAPWEEMTLTEQTRHYSYMELILAKGAMLEETLRETLREENHQKLQGHIQTLRETHQALKDTLGSIRQEHHDNTALWGLDPQESPSQETTLAFVATNRNLGSDTDILTEYVYRRRIQQNPLRKVYQVGMNVLMGVTPELAARLQETGVTPERISPDARDLIGDPQAMEILKRLLHDDIQAGVETSRLDQHIETVRILRGLPV